MTSNLVFSAADGHFFVFTCACGCDGCVLVTPLMARECVNPYFYVKGHQALGTAYEHIGQRYTFTASEAPASPLAAFSDAAPTDPWVGIEKLYTELPSEQEAGAMTDAEWDALMKSLNEKGRVHDSMSPSALDRCAVSLTRPPRRLTNHANAPYVPVYVYSRH